MNDTFSRMKQTLQTIQDAHKFNVAALRAHEVHALCFSALEENRPQATPLPEVCDSMQSLIARAMEPNGMDGLAGPHLELNPEKLVLAVAKSCLAQIESQALQYRKEGKQQAEESACWQLHEQIGRQFGLIGQ